MLGLRCRERPAVSDKGLQPIRCPGCATGLREGARYLLRAGLALDRPEDRLAEAVGPEPHRRELRAGARQLDALGDLLLVAAKGHRADRHTGGDRLLGYPHSAVADDTA